MIEKLLDETVIPFIRGGWLTGIVVGVLSPDGKRVYGYGRAGGERSPAPSGDSIFSIGSVTKVFTGILLADLVQSGMLKLDDPAGGHLPYSVPMPRHPARPDREITLLDLATHTSGLPLNPPDVMRLHGSAGAGEYPIERFARWLSRLNLGSVPGEKYEYSNLGMGILGCILARTLGTTFEEAVLNRICGPLGLASTRIGLNAEMMPRLVQGHDGELNPVRLADYTSVGGAGALRSTVNDLLRLIESNVGHDSRLVEAIEMAQEVRFRVDGNSGRGLGWWIDLENGIIDHWGSVGGYRAYAGFLKSRRLGVAVLSNTSAGMPADIGINLLRRLAGSPFAMTKLRKIVTIPREVLPNYEGCYELAGGMLFTVKEKEGRIWGHLSGERTMKLWPESDRRFFSRIIERDVVFEKDGRGIITGLSLGFGEDMRWAVKIGLTRRIWVDSIRMIGRIAKGV